MGIRLTGDNDFDRVWQAWVKAAGKAVDKGEAHTEFKKVLKTQEDKPDFVLKMVLAIDAQGRYKKHCDSIGKFCPEFPALHRWIKRNKMMDEIPSYSGTEDNTQKESRFCECGKETLGPKFDKCIKCYPDTTGIVDIMRKKWIEMGIDKTDYQTMMKIRNNFLGVK